MDRRIGDRLLPWIAASLLLFVAVVFTASQVPDAECGGPRDESGQGALVAVTIVAAALAVGAGLFCLVTMAHDDRFGRRDGWILGAVLLMLIGSAVAGSPTAAGLAIGGLIVTAVALVALVVAALRGTRADGVGVLLPIYLFGAAYVYLAVGLVALLATSGIGC